MIDGKEKALVWTEISKKVIKESEISNWEEDGEIEWGFDRTNGRLVIKGIKQLEEYANGCKAVMLTYDLGQALWTKRHGNQIKSIVICYGVSVIGRNAFSSCYSLLSVVIPDGVTSIRDYAFWECRSLIEVVIPESVESIGFNPFVLCGELRSIEVAEGNQHFIVVDGVLFNKEMTRLISFTACKKREYQIPKSVTHIGQNAFQGCSELETVSIPSSVTSILCSAFYECSGLTSITIPRSVSSIGPKVFMNCSRLRNVSVPRGLTYPKDTFPEGAKISKY